MCKVPAKWSLLPSNGVIDMALNLIRAESLASVRCTLVRASRIRRNTLDRQCGGEIGRTNHVLTARPALEPASE